jgi:hypothetical protein
VGGDMTTGMRRGQVDEKEHKMNENKKEHRMNANKMEHRMNANDMPSKGGLLKREARMTESELRSALKDVVNQFGYRSVLRAHQVAAVRIRAASLYGIIEAGLLMLNEEDEWPDMSPEVWEKLVADIYSDFDGGDVLRSLYVLSEIAGEAGDTPDALVLAMTYECVSLGVVAPTLMQRGARY